MGDTSLRLETIFEGKLGHIAASRNHYEDCRNYPVTGSQIVGTSQKQGQGKIGHAGSGKMSGDLSLPSPRAFFASAFSISAHCQRPLTEVMLHGAIRNYDF